MFSSCRGEFRDYPVLPLGTIFRRTTNLHKVWDSGIIQKTGLSEAEYVRQLEGQFQGQAVSGLQVGATIDWALESHRAAAEHAYHIPRNHQLAGALRRERAGGGRTARQGGRPTGADPERHLEIGIEARRSPASQARSPA